MPETSCMKATSVYITNNMRIKQVCNYKVLDFVTAFRLQNLFGNL